MENFAEGFRCEAFQNTTAFQALKPNDLLQLRIFGEWALGKLAEDPLIYRKIVLSDEAHILLK